MTRALLITAVLPGSRPFPPFPRRPSPPKHPRGPLHRALKEGVAAWIRPATHSPPNPPRLHNRREISQYLANTHELREDGQPAIVQHLNGVRGVFDKCLPSVLPLPSLLPSFPPPPLPSSPSSPSLFFPPLPLPLALYPLILPLSSLFPPSPPPLTPCRICARSGGRAGSGCLSSAATHLCSNRVEQRITPSPSPFPFPFPFPLSLLPSTLSLLPLPFFVLPSLLPFPLFPFSSRPFSPLPFPTEFSLLTTPDNAP